MPDLQHQRTKVIDLANKVALKVRDTLAGLVAVRCRANDSIEKSNARALFAQQGHSRGAPFGTSPQTIAPAPAQH